TGLIGHWPTSSAEHLLVWCAAIPACIILGRQWVPAVTTVGAGLILSFIPGIWVGAGAALAFVSMMMPKRLLPALFLPLVLILLGASSWIHPLSPSIHNENHVELLKAGIQMIRQHPWFGVGPERLVVHLEN